MTPYERQLAHLTRLASTPGFKEYAWRRAMELEAESALWQGISEQLKREMAARKSLASS